MSSLKSLLTENASVVSVSGHDVITTEALLKEFDLKTGRAEDVEFQENFTLISNHKSTRKFAVSKFLFSILSSSRLCLDGIKTTFTLEDNSSFFQGFATFFDVTFSQCHRVVQFSTSPRCVTVLYCLLCLLYCTVVLYCAVLCCTVLYCNQVCPHPLVANRVPPGRSVPPGGG